MIKKRYGAVAALLAAGLALVSVSLAAGRGRQAEMRPDEVARAFLDAYNTHDTPRLMALYAEEAQVATPDLATVGKADQRKYYEAWFQSVPDVKSALKTLTVEDNRFVLELLETGTYRKRLPTPSAPRARGQKLRYPYAVIGTVREGKITALRYYENDLLIEKQLGMR